MHFNNRYYGQLATVLFSFSITLFTGCTSLNPRVGAPPTVIESVAVAKIGSDARADTNGADAASKIAIESSWISENQNRDLVRLKHCEDYQKYILSLSKLNNDDEANSKEYYNLNLAAARSRARCLQQYILVRLDHVESIEQGTRLGLFLLGVGGTAAGFFGASDDLIASLGLGAGLFTGARNFHPLERRQILYFSAMAALECSIMTADSVSLDQHEKLKNSLFSTLYAPQTTEGTGAADDAKTVNDYLQEDNASKQLNEILSKRLHLARSGYREDDLSGLKCQSANSLLDPYADFLTSSAYELGLRQQSLSVSCEDEESQVDAGLLQKQTLTSVAATLNTKMTQAATDGVGLAGPLLFVNAVKLSQANQQLLDAFMQNYIKSELAAQNAPQNLDNATTLISIAVNKSIIEEQADTAGLINAARAAVTQFLEGVQAGQELAKTFSLFQSAELESAKTTIETVSGTVQAQLMTATDGAGGVMADAGNDDGSGGSDDLDSSGNGDSQSDASAERKKMASEASAVLSQYSQTINNIENVREQINFMLEQLNSYSDYPQACRALINGNIGDDDDETA